MFQAAPAQHHSQACFASPVTSASPDEVGKTHIPQQPPSVRTAWVRWQRLFAALLCSAALLPSLQGCDEHKAEREAAASQLNGQQAKRQQLQAQHERAQSALSSVQKELASQRENLANRAQALAERRSQLMVYMSENKATILALVATGAGAVTALDEDTRRTVQQEFGQGSSDLVVTAGIFGAGYCLFNLDECTSVSARLAAHASETSAIKTHAQQISSQLAELEQSVQQHQSQVQKLTQQLQETESVISASQQRMAELRCKGPFC